MGGKICGVINVENQWGRQKYVELYTWMIWGDKSMWSYIYIEGMWVDTKICRFIQDVPLGISQKSGECSFS